MKRITHKKKEVPFCLTTIKLTRESFLLIVTVNFFYAKILHVRYIVLQLKIAFPFD